MDNKNKGVEEKWYKYWEEHGYFKAKPDSSQKPYSLLMPPPNLTGKLHLGHAMQHTVMDAIARFKRMQGYDVLLLPGIDHASIQFENALNKILEKEGLSKRKLGKEKFLERAWKFKDEMYQSFHKDWTVFGISADWSREVFTLDEIRNKAVFEEFKRYYDDGLVYKGAYIVQWCPKCGTAIEDIEMEYQERKEKLYYVRYIIPSNELEYITVATARPETIYADVAIAVYPNHPKYKKYIGKSAINPLATSTDALRLKIIEDKRVDKDFGTGALKITPGHDRLDYEIGKDNNLRIKHAIDKNGRMTEIAGDLASLKVEEARVRAIERLGGAIEDVKDYVHSVPVCERCKTIVEPLISEEWFVKMKPLAEKALKRLDEIKFFPKSYEKILADWMKEIHDWCISRNLWWGQRMPIWYKDYEIKISMDSPGTGWLQEEKIFDTWFSSGLWPLSALGWSFDFAQDKSGIPEEMEKYFPWDFEITAPEIKYLWIARMIMISLYLSGKIPFKNMFFHGTLRDVRGRKFSKSLGNGINPNDLREAWGTDATRMALYSYSAPGRDGRTSRQIMDERCRNFRNFGTKLKNIYRFIYELKPETRGEKLGGESESSETSSSRYQDVSRQDQRHPTSNFKMSNPDDQWIMEELGKTVTEVTKNLESFHLHLAIEALYEFIWHQFADIYIEKSKKRRGEAQLVLEEVFKKILITLHPFMPFLTEELYQKLSQHQESIMLETWPE